MTETVVRPPLITEIPTQTQLEEQGYGQLSRMHTFEAVSPELLSGYDPNIRTTLDDRNRLLLDNLKNQLLFDNPDNSSNLVRNGYSVARQIGDSFIKARSEDAFSLLDHTRLAASHNLSFVSNTHDSQGVEVSGHYQAHQELNVNTVDLTGAGYQAIEGRAQREGLIVGGDITPGDLRLFTFLRTAGHEAAHAFDQAVASTFSRPIDRENEERFAEGYGVIVVEEAARLLGYGSDVIAPLKQALQFTAEDMNAREHFAGKGYEQPYSAEEVIDALENTARELRGPAEVEQVHAETVVVPQRRMNAIRKIGPKLGKIMMKRRRARVNERGSN